MPDTDGFLYTKEPNPREKFFHLLSPYIIFDKAREFEKYIDSCIGTDKPIISSGMSKYKKGIDNTYHAVFNRADKLMYARKEALKEH